MLDQVVRIVGLGAASNRKFRAKLLINFKQGVSFAPPSQEMQALRWGGGEATPTMPWVLVGGEWYILSYVILYK